LISSQKQWKKLKAPRSSILDTNSFNV